jgi:hypothetical protein
MERPMNRLERLEGFVPTVHNLAAAYALTLGIPVVGYGRTLDGEPYLTIRTDEWSDSTTNVAYAIDSRGNMYFKQVSK